jgi:hypothetical protein
MIHFLVGLFQHGVEHGLSEVLATTMFKSLLPDFIKHLNFPKPVPTPAAAVKLRGRNRGSMSWYPEPSEEDIAPYVKWAADMRETSAFLPCLLDIMYELGMSKQATELLKSMQSAAETVDVEYFVPFFLPFIRGMLLVWPKREISPTGPICRPLYASVWRSFMERYVGKEPPEQINWARTPSACKCTICVPLHKFLKDPVKQRCLFTNDYKDQDHIIEQVEKASGSYRQEPAYGPEYELQLVIIKTETQWEREWDSWDERCSEVIAEVEMCNLGILGGIVGSELKDILSELLEQEPGASVAIEADSPSPRSGKKQKTGTNGSVHVSGSSVLTESDGNSRVQKTRKGAGKKRKAA